MGRYEYLNGPPSPRMVAELAMRHDALVKQLADAQATIAALQARVEAHERAYQEGHPSPCTLGSYCPYCEIERRVAQLTQRTAELEALRAWRDYVTVALQRPGGAFFEDVPKHIIDLVAELERVRGELVEATHNANVYQSLYSTGCMDRALLENELRDIRTLILALPKVEGEIVAQAGYVKDRKKVYACFGSGADMTAYAALLTHRQGMEG